MDTLIVCHVCRHGAPLHSREGCGVKNCTCSHDVAAVVDHMLGLVRDEVYNQYRGDYAADA